MAEKPWYELKAWAEGLEAFAREAGLDTAEPIDARLIEFMKRAGGDVAWLLEDHARLAEENEELRARVKRLEMKLFAIINMASDISKYAKRAIDKHVSPDE